MSSAGNDIVALAATDVARTRQPDFYSRIISPVEQELYPPLRDKLPFEHYVWLVWSVKESAYKFLKRYDPGLIFSPSKMTLSTLNFSDQSFDGALQAGNYSLCSRSFITEDYIFSIVDSEPQFAGMHFGISSIDSVEPDEQSKAVREMLFAKLNEVFPRDDLQITKNPYGWPVVFKNGEELSLPISFTHHGNFIAYTFHLDSVLWKARAEIL